MDFAQNYKTKVLPELKKELKKTNVFAVPRLKQINFNVGIGSIMTRGNKDYETVIKNVMAITGQKPLVTIARKAISNFKLKEKTPVGLMTTLRGKRMLDFLNKLINVVLPRVRDFRGISGKSFDGHGNYNLGLKDQTVFSEVNTDDIEKLHGVQITIVTTTNNDKEAYALLKALGMPFKKDEQAPAA